MGSLNDSRGLFYKVLLHQKGFWTLVRWRAAWSVIPVKSNNYAVDVRPTWRSYFQNILKP